MHHAINNYYYYYKRKQSHRLDCWSKYPSSKLLWIIVSLYFNHFSKSSYSVRLLLPFKETEVGCISIHTQTIQESPWVSTNPIFKTTVTLNMHQILIGQSTNVMGIPTPGKICMNNKHRRYGNIHDFPTVLTIMEDIIMR